MKQFILIICAGINLLSFGQNTAPVAVDDTIFFTYGEAHMNDSIKLDVDFILNDHDVDGNTLKVESIIYSGQNQLTANIPIDYVIWLHYYPSLNYSGTESFEYVIRDNGVPVKYDTGIVTLTVIRKSFENLTINNINATIDKDALFIDPTRAGKGFESPKSGGVNTIYGSNIWITGLHNGSVHSNIRVYGSSLGSYSGNSGPVSNVSHTDSLFNTKWDRVWKVSNHQIDWHMNHWNDVGYQPVQELLDWPAHGNITKGEAANLAPFVDHNNDQVYNPYDGDYPLIKGDEAIYFIYNDGKSQISLHPMITEVHGMAYAFGCNDSALMHTVFVDYKIYNRSNKTYFSTRVGMWSDIDLGSSFDDYVQSDVDRSLFFTYNGNDYDAVFKNNPGAQAVMILRGLKQDNDGVDNMVGIGAGESINGSGFGDGVVDNESWGMEYFQYYTNSFGVVLSDPQVEWEYNNYLSGKWKDGSSIIHGGNGHHSSITTSPISTKYMFPDTSDSQLYGTGGIVVPTWNDASVQMPGDRRGVASTGPVTFAPGDAIELTYAFVLGRDYAITGAQAGVDNMLKRVDSVRSYYNQGKLNPCGFPLNINAIDEVVDCEIYPNPAREVIHIKMKKMELVNIELFDGTGKILWSKRVNQMNVSISMSQFSNGIYFVKVSSKDRVRVEKIIKR
jgi:hypothetical protein